MKTEIASNGIVLSFCYNIWTQNCTVYVTCICICCFRTENKLFYGNCGM